jgi:hypothetical protein
MYLCPEYSSMPHLRIEAFLLALSYIIAQKTLLQHFIIYKTSKHPTTILQNVLDLIYLVVDLKVCDLQF